MIIIYHNNNDNDNNDQLPSALLSVSSTRGSGEAAGFPCPCRCHHRYYYYQYSKVMFHDFLFNFTDYYYCYTRCNTSLYVYEYAVCSMYANDRYAMHRPIRAWHAPQTTDSANVYQTSEETKSVHEPYPFTRSLLRVLSIR